VSASPLTVVVHGATGAQGAPIARAMLTAGHRVRAAVRRPDPTRLPAGVEPVGVHLEDADGLARIYAGADAVVVHLPGPAVPDALAAVQADAVLDALRRAAVPRAIFNASGAVWNEPVGVPFLDARTRLAGGLAGAVEVATVLAPTTRYMENLAEPWVIAALRDGVLRQPAPPGAAAPWLALDDLATLAADLLADPDPPDRLALVGPQSLTGQEVVATLSDALGRKVRHETVSFAAYNEQVAATLGAQYAAGLAKLYAPDARIPPPASFATTATWTTTLATWTRERAWPA